MEASEDHVLAGAEGVLEEAEDLDLHGLGLSALENGVGDARLAGVELREGEDAGFSGRAWSWGQCGCGVESDGRLGDGRERESCEKAGFKQGRERMVARANLSRTLHVYQTRRMAGPAGVRRKRALKRADRGSKVLS
jgi:hypothetical protein